MVRHFDTFLFSQFLIRLFCVFFFRLQVFIADDAGIVIGGLNDSAVFIRSPFARHITILDIHIAVRCGIGIMGFVRQQPVGITHAPMRAADCSGKIHGADI